MAKAASEYIRRMPMRDDIRHRPVGRGMPIRYGKEVQELRLGKRRLTVGEVDQFDIVRRRGIPGGRRVERKQPLRYAKPARLSRRAVGYQTEGHNDIAGNRRITCRVACIAGRDTSRHTAEADKEQNAHHAGPGPHDKCFSYRVINEHAG